MLRNYPPWFSCPSGDQHTTKFVITITRYTMDNGGTYAGHRLSAAEEDSCGPWMHTWTGSLGFRHAQLPYGRWNQMQITLELEK